jgi:orotate phosphoribosyltransferase
MVHRKPHQRHDKPKSNPKLDSSIVNISYDQAREQLAELISQKALFFGDSILPSGRITTNYLDLKEALLSARGIYLSSMVVLNQLKDDVQAIGGTFTNTYSIAATTSQLAFIRGQELDSFYVRDNYSARRQGLSKWIEGPLKPGAKVCLVLDEVVDGLNVIEMVRTLQQEADAEILQVIAIVDRLDGAASRLEEYGVDYTTILTMRDIEKLARV